MATDTVTRPLPGSYSEMYPGRFLKADMLKGQKVTVTITEIEGEDLIGENNKAKSEWIVRIKERPLQLVLNKTNAFCLYRMFGGDPHSWLGKRITVYPTTTKFGRNTVDAIRVWGSPDLAEDLEITVPQGRKKAWETVMHKVELRKSAAAPGETPAATTIPAGLDPRILVAFAVLGWDTDTAQAITYLNENKSLTPQQMLSDLNRVIDETA